MLGPVLISTVVSQDRDGQALRRSRVGRKLCLRLGLSAAFALVPCLLSRTASAFERQWHLGAGVGVVLPGETYATGGAAALHLAYGLSDVFDARLTLAGSMHESDDELSQKTSLGLATLGLAYKLDIIEWVPYFGVRAGGYYFGEAPFAPYSRAGGALGGMAGIDYSFSRSFAIGAELSYDELLPEGHVSGALLRAEYRWGF